MKILLLSNPMPHYHRIENTLPALQKALDGVELHHSQNVGDLNAENLRAYDAVLVYCTGQKLDDAILAEADEVRVVHGRGSGTLRAAVQRVLSRTRAVREFHQAPPHLGGDGATIVVLK